MGVDVVRGHDSGATVLTLNNPTQKNALDNATRTALLEALRVEMSSSDCGVIILTGHGGTFCAGGELKSMPTEEEPIRRRMGELHEIIELILTGPKPVLAAVEGFAVGSGVSLVAACDIVVAASTARFGCSFGKVGLMPDGGLLWTLQRRMTLGAAKRLVLIGAMMNADDALHEGLVDRVVDVESPLASALDIASELSHSAPMSIAASKQLLAAGELPLADFLGRELDNQVELLASADFAEGRDAFFSRRRPDFHGS